MGIYLSAGMAISILGLFAAHNHRTGWKKTRTNLAEALDDLYADFGLSSEAPISQMNEVAAPSRSNAPVDARGFSLQLINLDKALRESTSTAPRVVEHVEGELTAAQAR